MRGVLSVTSGGAEFVIEVTPQYTLVGAGHAANSDQMKAMVVVEYTHEDILFMQRVAQVLHVMSEHPIIAMYEDTVQVSFSVKQPAEELMSIVKKHFPVISHLDELAAVHITSMADMFPEEPTFALFQEIHASYGEGTLLLMGESVMSAHSGCGTPFASFTFGAVKHESQSLMAE